MKRQGKKDRKPPEVATGMSVIVRTITRLTVGVFLLYGFHIVTQGHLIPGGGFAGGVIAALSFLNIMVAFGSDIAFKKLTRVRAVCAACLGMLLVLLIGIAGLRKGAYFSDFLLGRQGFSAVCDGGSILLYNIGIFVLVSAGLCAVFISFIASRSEGDSE
ncbi:MAG: MnhB domain-containing protein [Candidatus Omnitrophica bacterium]|nr:MnhB domain-containing protein [Candidatus Omnitrophota bacterium]